MTYKVGTVVRLRTHAGITPSWCADFPVGSAGLIAKVPDKVVFGVGVQMLHPAKLGWFPARRFEQYWEIVREPDDE